MNDPILQQPSDAFLPHSQSMKEPRGGEYEKPAMTDANLSGYVISTWRGAYCSFRQFASLCGSPVFNLGSYIRLPAVFVYPKFSLVFMINRIIVKKKYKRRFRLTDASHLKHLPGGDSRGLYSFLVFFSTVLTPN